MKLSNQLAIAGIVVASFFAIDRYERAAGDAHRRQAVPQVVIVPAFHLPQLGSPEGTEVSLQSLRGRTSFLEFWASWCESCVQERPLLNKLRAANPKASMLAIATLDDADSVRKSEATNPHGYPVLIDAPGSVAQSIGIDAIPQSLVIDDQGKVLRHFKGPLRETDLEEIGTLLN